MMMRRMLGRLFWAGACLAMLAPVIYAILSSLKGKGEFYQTAWWALPAKPLVGNYVTAFDKIHFFELAMNSLVISTGTVAGVLVLSSMAAFALAFFRGALREVSGTGLVVFLMVPLAVGIVPLLLFSARIGWLDSPFALWGPYVAFNLPFSIYLLKAYYEELPVEVLEAATVDGASFFQVYGRLVVPMGTPMLATLAAIVFVKIWGEFALALALLPNPKWWTLGVGIFNYAEMLKGYSMPEMLAAAVLGIVPSLIAFILCQKALFSVSLSGAVKG